MGSDRYQFQTNQKVDRFYTFSENFKMMSKILKIMTPLTLIRKIKLCKLAKL
jgi:hypothetical protein